MPNLLVRHRVRDFKTWKKVFDEHASTRRAAGCTGGKLFRTLDDPNDVLLLFTWDTAENARAFSKSEDLRVAMEKAGVVGLPTVVFLGEAELVTR